MPVIEVNRMWSREDSDAQLEDRFKKAVLNYTDTYQVLCTADTTISEIYSAPGLPAAGSTYPGNPYIYAQKARPQRISPTLWHVTIGYSGEVGINASGQVVSPIDARPRKRYVSREVEKEVDEDYLGNRITNVIGEPLKARVTFYERQLIITRNMPFFNTYALSDYDEATNSDWFEGWPPGTGRVRIDAENVFSETSGYFVVTGTFTFKKPYRTTPDKAWYSRIRNDGFYEKKDLVGPPAPGQPTFKIIPAVDDHNEPVTQPVQLDVDGYRLTNGTAYWLEFQHFTPLPFSALGLV